MFILLILFLLLCAIIYFVFNLSKRQHNGGSLSPIIKNLETYVKDITYEFEGSLYNGSEGNLLNIVKHIHNYIADTNEPTPAILKIIKTRLLIQQKHTPMTYMIINIIDKLDMRDVSPLVKYNDVYEISYDAYYTTPPIQNIDNTKFIQLVDFPLLVSIYEWEHIKRAVIYKKQGCTVDFKAKIDSILSTHGDQVCVHKYNHIIALSRCEIDAPEVVEIKEIAKYVVDELSLDNDPDKFTINFGKSVGKYNGHLYAVFGSANCQHTISVHTFSGLNYELTLYQLVQINIINIEKNYGLLCKYDYDHCIFSDKKEIMTFPEFNTVAAADTNAELIPYAEKIIQKYQRYARHLLYLAETKPAKHSSVIYYDKLQNAVNVMNKINADIVTTIKNISHSMEYTYIFTNNDVRTQKVVFRHLNESISSHGSIEFVHNNTMYIQRCPIVNKTEYELIHKTLGWVREKSTESTCYYNIGSGMRTYNLPNPLPLTGGNNLSVLVHKLMSLMSKSIVPLLINIKIADEIVCETNKIIKKCEEICVIQELKYYNDNAASIMQHYPYIKKFEDCIRIVKKMNHAIFYGLTEEIIDTSLLNGEQSVDLIYKFEDISVIDIIGKPSNSELEEEYVKTLYKIVATTRRTRKSMYLPTNLKKTIFEKGYASNYGSGNKIPAFTPCHVLIPPILYVENDEVVELAVVDTD